MNTVCNTVKVKNTNRGGRLYSALLASAIENGSIIFLGGLVWNYIILYLVNCIEIL